MNMKFTYIIHLLHKDMSVTKSEARMIINVNKPLLKLGWELVPNLDDQI